MTLALTSVPFPPLFLHLGADPLDQRQDGHAGDVHQGTPPPLPAFPALAAHLISSFSFSSVPCVARCAVVREGAGAHRGTPPLLRGGEGHHAPRRLQGAPGPDTLSLAPAGALTTFCCSLSFTAARSRPRPAPPRPAPPRPGKKARTPPCVDPPRHRDSPGTPLSSPPSPPCV